MKVAETNLFQSIEHKHKPIVKNHIIPMSTDETSTEKPENNKNSNIFRKR